MKQATVGYPSDSAWIASLNSLRKEGFITLEQYALCMANVKNRSK
jgi:hypothetical protein